MVLDCDSMEDSEAFRYDLAVLSILLSSHIVINLDSDEWNQQNKVDRLFEYLGFVKKLHETIRLKEGNTEEDDSLFFNRHFP